MFLPLSLVWYIFKGHCQIFDFPPVLSENAVCKVCSVMAPKEASELFFSVTSPSGPQSQS